MKKIIVIYDNWCPNCTRFKNIITKIDWLHKINFKGLRNEDKTLHFENLNVELAKQQMASFVYTWEYGYVSLYNIFKRIPFLWLFVPFFFLLKITGLGQYLYVQLAIRRKIIPLHCDIHGCNIK